MQQNSLDKNTVIAFVLIFLVVVITPYFVGEPAKPIAQKAKEEKTNSVKEPQEAEVGNILKENTQSIAPSATNQVEEKVINVETDLYLAKFSSIDGRVISWKFKKYKKKDGSNELVELIRKDKSNFTKRITLNNGTVLENIPFTVDKTEIKLDNNHPTAELNLVYNLDGKSLVKLKYIFSNDAYAVNCLSDYSAISSLIKQDGGIELLWDNGLVFTELSEDGSTNREEYFIYSYVKKQGEEREEFDKDDAGIERGKIEWASTRVKYFEAFIMTRSPEFVSDLKEKDSKDLNKIEKELKRIMEQYQDYSFAKFNQAIMIDSKLKNDHKYSDLGFNLKVENDSPKQIYTLLLAPLDDSLLDSYDSELATTMNWGWDIVKPFSYAVLYSLKFLHRFISNYGVVIILLSLIVNFILLPFTIKTYKSQEEMKRIQPYLAEIKEKYKGDMQRQQQETMKLYKEHNVNPFGSCLPTLLPFPILYGMFTVFRATIEFRGADFALWINDLSLPEVFISLPFSIPLYGANIGLLPILMAVTMFFQMKGTLSSKSDPNQKMMAYFMPIFLMVLFNNFASGLILYYTVGNIFRLVQQKMVKIKK